MDVEATTKASLFAYDIEAFKIALLAYTQRSFVFVIARYLYRASILSTLIYACTPAPLVAPRPTTMFGLSHINYS
jgi:hypothetical protein